MDVRGKCPRRGHIRLLERYTGEIRWATCDSPSCGYCGPWRAKLAGVAIGIALPSQAILVTTPGDRYDQIQPRLKRALYEIRRSGFELEYAWAAEYFPKGGVHVHLALHGDAVPESLLERAFRREGTGLVRSERVRNPTGFGLYMKKWPISALGLDIAAAERLLAEVRALNGTRTVSASPRFWRDSSGHTLTGLREAIALARRTRGGRPSLSIVP
jgi:hypothetical protein